MTRKQIKEQAARYTKFVEWSDEDRCFIGRCPELMLGGVHGDDEAKVYAELCGAVEEMIELMAKDKHALPEPLTKRNSAASLCCALNLRCTVAWQPRRLPTGKASTVIASRRSAKREGSFGAVVGRRAR